TQRPCRFAEFVVHQQVADRVRFVAVDQDLQVRHDVSPLELGDGRELAAEDVLVDRRTAVATAEHSVFGKRFTPLLEAAVVKAVAVAGYRVADDVFVSHERHAAYRGAGGLRNNVTSTRRGRAHEQ